MTFADSFLAVDWGSTNRRIYRIEGGSVAAVTQDALGVTAIGSGGFPDAVAEIRARCGDLPMLLAGMVGSTIGWRVAPYLSLPADLGALAAGLLRIDARTAIVPGLSVVDGRRGDVMRGEEVQLFGAVAGGLAPADALLVQPGTHCKWATMAAGAVIDFTTAMTGELFALLRGHSILKSQLGAPVADGAAFREGVEAGKRRDLAASLFGIRSAGLLGLRDDAEAAAYGSGVLIGADVAARLAESGFDTVHLLADPPLGSLYAAAIEANGRRVHRIDSQAAFLSGIIAIGTYAT